MKRRLHFLPFFFSCMMLCILPSCEDDERPTFPLSAEIFHSVSGQQVAFTALTHSATSWSWDFGDGNTSTEKNPVHTYEEGGYYLATLTAKDAGGNTVTKETRVALALTPFSMLVGNHTADGYTGKTWKLSSDHSVGGDYFADANAALTPVAGTPVPLPTGIFDLEFAMGDIYKDTYTFHYDGSYQRDPKEDGASFGGLVYEYVVNGGAGIVNDNGEDFGLCIAKAPAEEGATYTFTEDEDYDVPTVYGGISFENAMTLDFSGNEFIGFRDFHRKVVIKSLTDSRMTLIMFMAAGQDAAIIGVPTHALILSFDAVN